VNGDARDVGRAGPGGEGSSAVPGAQPGAGTAPSAPRARQLGGGQHTQAASPDHGAPAACWTGPPGPADIIRLDLQIQPNPGRHPRSRGHRDGGPGPQPARIPPPQLSDVVIGWSRTVRSTGPRQVGARTHRSASTTNLSIAPVSRETPTDVAPARAACGPSTPRTPLGRRPPHLNRIRARRDDQAPHTEWPHARSRTGTIVARCEAASGLQAHTASAPTPFPAMHDFDDRLTQHPGSRH
jgi:hypothetical protein